MTDVWTPVDSSWKLIFDEEFNGSSINTAKWTTNWFGTPGAITRPVNSYETGAYDPAQVSVSDGFLHIETAASPATVGGKTYAYRTGIAHSNQNFEFTYGYAEARITLEGSDGKIANWPTFWLDGQNWPYDGEIDIMEGLEGLASWHFHYAHGDPGGSAPGDFTGTHVFGALWEPGSISYFYDGVKVGTITSGVTSAPMYIIINNAMGPWGGETVIGADMAVDYVHVYSRNPNLTAVTPEAGYGGPGDNGTPLAGDFQTIIGTAGADTLAGSSVADQIDGREGNDVVNGSDGSDVLLGGSGADKVSGGVGDDSLDGGAGRDNVTGDSGADVLHGGLDDDTVLGSDGADALYGDDGSDNLKGGNHDDVLYGAAGSDRLLGNGGNDSLYGGGDGDRLWGAAGNDRLIGEDGNDILQGEAGKDTLDAGAGDDIVIGGRGSDALTGGGGRDIFTFTKGEAAGDVIVDFTGNGTAAGDSLQFMGFGSGANLIYLGHDLWSITDGATAETFTLTGVSTLDSSDVSFV
jgi:Ca2+-binding RTX toxin-like protein